MTTTDVERRLMDFFAAMGAAPGHTFTIRDFNSQVMMNVYTPEDRACLGLALAALAEAGVVLATSPTDYCLTPEGLRRVRAIRYSRA